MFEKAVKLILAHEGEYVNDPGDPGGETKYGISKRSYPELNIRNLKKEDAITIYRSDYWTKCNCDNVPYPIALLLFDTAVNMGVKSAIELLQAALCVRVDGIIGHQTMTKINSMEPSYIAVSFCALRMERYQKMSTFKRFGYSWTRRVLGTLIEAFKK